MRRAPLAFPPLTPGLALGWSLLLTLSLSAAGAVVSTLLGPSPGGLLVLAVLEVALYASGALALGRFYASREPRQALALQPVRALPLVTATSLGVLLHLPAGYLDALVERRYPTPRVELLRELEQLSPSSPAHALSLLLGVALLAPLAEELFFRGALATALSRTSPSFVVIWTTSVAFVLAHPKPRMWAPLLLVALVLAELRRASGSIWPGFALHAAFNATTLLSVFASQPPQLKAPDPDLRLGLLGAVLCGAGVWGFRRLERGHAQEER